MRNIDYFTQPFSFCCYCSEFLIAAVDVLCSLFSCSSDENHRVKTRLSTVSDSLSSTHWEKTERVKKNKKALKLYLKKTTNPKVMQRREKVQNEKAFWGNFSLRSSNALRWMALPMPYHKTCTTWHAFLPSCKVPQVLSRKKKQQNNSLPNDCRWSLN